MKLSYDEFVEKYFDLSNKSDIVQQLEQFHNVCGESEIDFLIKNAYNDYINTEE